MPQASNNCWFLSYLFLSCFLMLNLFYFHFNMMLLTLKMGSLEYVYELGYF